MCFSGGSLSLLMRTAVEEKKRFLWHDVSVLMDCSHLLEGSVSKSGRGRPQLFVRALINIPIPTSHLLMCGILSVSIVKQNEKNVKITNYGQLVPISSISSILKPLMITDSIWQPVLETLYCSAIGKWIK